ncbi:MAG: hypothetical protein HZB66_03660, partial [Candidatus Aenigmarchaeota archaeon]|nr:hypothetical protein [Candidatus Aenigmarchaeota archaeon]
YVSGKMHHSGYEASINLNAFRREEVKQARGALRNAGFVVSITGEDAYCHEPFPQRR